jgi:hypothetical protein
MTAEQWRPIAAYEGYFEVSSLGRVRSLPRVIMRRNGAPQTIRGRVLCQQPMSNGFYPKVDLSRDGVSRTRPVHRLVGEAFLGPRPLGLETRHLNGDGFDNRLENLCYGTHTENMQDAIAHGTHPSVALKARTHCAKNHPYDERTRYAPNGSRICARCDVATNIASQKRAQARREAAGEVTPHVIREWAAPLFDIDPTRVGRMHNDIKWAYAYAHPEKGWTPSTDPRRTTYTPPTPRDLIAAYPHLEAVIETRELRAA